MKIIIVSGFLGSGKTTFIEKLSKKLDDSVILENDYAKANVDKDLLKNTGINWNGWIVFRCWNWKER